MIARTLLDLADRPDAWAALKAGADVETAVEEFIRWVTPIHNMCRTATADTEIAGQTVRKGQQLVMMYPSANRDPAHFADPEAYDVTRSPNNHIAFGFGTHFCLGAALARLEIQVFFEQLPGAGGPYRAHRGRPAGGDAQRLRPRPARGPPSLHRDLTGLHTPAETARSRTVPASSSDLFSYAGKKVVLTGAPAAWARPRWSCWLGRAAPTSPCSTVNEPTGPATAYVAADLSDPNSIDAACEAIGPGVDVLFNNAGVAGVHASDFVLRVNYLGLRRLSEGLLPTMSRGGGHRQHRFGGRAALAPAPGRDLRADRSRRLGRAPWPGSPSTASWSTPRPTSSPRRWPRSGPCTAPAAATSTTRCAPTATAPA